MCARVYSLYQHAILSLNKHFPCRDEQMRGSTGASVPLWRTWFLHVGELFVLVLWILNTDSGLLKQRLYCSFHKHYSSFLFGTNFVPWRIVCIQFSSTEWCNAHSRLQFESEYRLRSSWRNFFMWYIYIFMRFLYKNMIYCIINIISCKIIKWNVPLTFT